MTKARTPQGCNSATFKPPNFAARELTLPEAWDLHAQNSAQHKLFTFATAAGVRHDILWPQAVKALHRGAKLVQQHLGVETCQTRPLVAILASSGMHTIHLNTVWKSKADRGLSTIL
jgi:hypothetical protein